MLYIILVELLYQDLKMLECGMLWQNVMKKWIKKMKLPNVTKELINVKIKKV